MDHEARMALAGQVTDFLRRAHPEIVAVAIEGSTAKGEDRAHSDLERVAVTRGPSKVKAYQTLTAGS